MTNANRSTSKSSWEMVKELMVDMDKRELLADRAESLLLCLKQRFPGLPQTTLDMSKIQYNKVWIFSYSNIWFLLVPSALKLIQNLQLHWFEIFTYSGCREIYSRELFKSFGEPGIQYYFPYWWSTICWWLNQAFGSTFLGSHCQCDCSQEGFYSILGTSLEHSICNSLYHSELLTCTCG